MRTLHSITSRILSSIITVIVWCIAPSADAKVTLPSVISDNMVLQRNSDVNLWGKATPGKKVTVVPSWNGKKYSTMADNEGKWKLKIATTDAGGPYTIKISDGEQVRLDNILLGEVWICGGQSNMEMQVHGFMHQPVKGSVDAILDATNHPGMRFFTVGRASLDTPADDCSGEWLLSTPEAVANFSAASYFFGHLLNTVLGVPVGLVTTNWGGSPVETWMAEETFETVEGIDKDFCRRNNYENSAVGRLFNGMVNPITSYTAKGFIWYQGESNNRRHDDYVKLLKAMITDWRKRWDNPSMPFYMVQIAPYRYTGYDNFELPLLIEAQYKVAQEMENVGIAATTDLGNPVGIHPARKKEVGERLAFLALRNDYGVEGIPLPAPTYKSMSINGNKVKLEFNNLDWQKDWWAGNNFHSYQDDRYIRPKGFEVAGEDRVFRKAEGKFGHGENYIEVYSDSVPNPVAVRYCFHNYVPEANVMTCLGQPLVPFRTDRWDVEY